MADEEYEVVINDDPQEVVKVEAIITNLKGQIQQSQFASALKLASTTFPSTLKSPALKQNIVDVFGAIFSNYTANEAFLKELNAEQRASILKYATKQMALGDKKICDSALGFYTLIIKIEGPGAVARTLTCRRF
jgi:hypothetical protein